MTHKEIMKQQAELTARLEGIVFYENNVTKRRWKVIQEEESKGCRIVFDDIVEDYIVLFEGSMKLPVKEINIAKDENGIYLAQIITFSDDDSLVLIMGADEYISITQIPQPEDDESDFIEFQMEIKKIPAALPAIKTDTMYNAKDGKITEYSFMLVPNMIFNPIKFNNKMLAPDVLEQVYLLAIDLWDLYRIPMMMNKGFMVYREREGLQLFEFEGMNSLGFISKDRDKCVPLSNLLIDMNNRIAVCCPDDMMVVAFGETEKDNKYQIARIPDKEKMQEFEADETLSQLLANVAEYTKDFGSSEYNQYPKEIYYNRYKFRKDLERIYDSMDLTEIDVNPLNDIIELYEYLLNTYEVNGILVITEDLETGREMFFSIDEEYVENVKDHILTFASPDTAKTEESSDSEEVEKVSGDVVQEISDNVVLPAEEVKSTGETFESTENS